MPDNVFEDESPIEEQEQETTQETPASPAAEPPVDDNSLPSEDDVFAFLDNDAGPDEEPPVEAAPAAQANTHPPAAPESVAPPSAMDRLAEQMATFLGNQNRPAPQEAPAAPPVWVDPFQRPENKERLEQLQQDGMFSADAAREFNALQLQLMEERMDHKYEMREAATRSQVLSVNQLNSVNDTAFNELAQGAAYVDRASFDAATEEFIQSVFGGDRTAFAASASNPVIRQQIANNAELRAIKNRAQNKAAPTSKPTTTARPAGVAAAAPASPPRASSPSGRTYSAVEQRLATDTAYEEDVSSRAFGIGPKKRNN